MTDIFTLFGLTQEQIARARELQRALPQDLAARARASSAEAACFLERMRREYPDIHARWQSELLRGNLAPTDTFLSRLPERERAIGDALFRNKSADFGNLLPYADRLATTPPGNERIRGESLARLAMFDITENVESCGVAQINRHHAPRLPRFGA